MSTAVVVTAVVACVAPCNVPCQELDRAGFTVMPMAVETELVMRVLSTTLAGII